MDKTLKPPDPLAPVVDHIIPVNKGGHPSDIKNLNYMINNWSNRQKSDKLFKTTIDPNKGLILGNRNLPLSIDWTKYKSK